MQEDDYISRKDAIKAVKDLPDCPNGFSDTYDKACIIGMLEEVPSAISNRETPVKLIETQCYAERGHDEFNFIGYRCPICNKLYFVNEGMKYCSCCGQRLAPSDSEAFECGQRLSK